MNSKSLAEDFVALGGRVMIQAGGSDARAAVNRARSLIEEIQIRLTRFEPTSELSRLNADHRTRVPVSPIMMRFVTGLIEAGRMSGGLVDGTLLAQLERAGYIHSMDFDHPDAETSPVRIDGSARYLGQTDGKIPSGWWLVSACLDTGEISRPPGLRFDSGGLGKGLATDVAGEVLAHLDHFAVECSGDLRFGGAFGGSREIQVNSPIRGQAAIASLQLAEAAVATSGITRRSWLDHRGKVSHHLIDPRTGRPAFTGVSQVTAVAPTGIEAETRAKAALLSGPDDAADWLPHGGVIFTDDGEVLTVESDCTRVQAA